MASTEFLLAWLAWVAICRIVQLSLTLHASREAFANLLAEEFRKRLKLSERYFKEKDRVEYLASELRDRDEELAEQELELRKHRGWKNTEFALEVKKGRNKGKIKLKAK